MVKMKKSNAVKCTVSHMKMLMYWANGVANWPIPCGPVHSIGDMVNIKSLTLKQ
ncbi:hypothetical protein BLOT_009445 [Blomia tropicalis]|nr:hypothetical protein BLOT_009445 [Blomia tropicalis]